jgi:hypothetical protein
MVAVPLWLLGGLVVLAGLALRFGVDSRPGADSPEQQQARRGFAWDGTPGQGRRFRRARSAARLRVRAWAADVLYRLAEWVAPGVPAAP